jgi:Uma2 family endonuclease
LESGQARNCGTHWVGGPDFVVEVVSFEDRTREKIGFYASIGARELLIVDRAPWQLEHYRLVSNSLVLIG